jgi:hypothetical protein
MPLKWTPDNILVRAGGSVALAGLNTFLNHRTNQVSNFLRNGDMLDWVVILADLMNVAPDGTMPGTALDAATDAALYDLASALFTNRLGSIVPEFGTLTAVPVTPAGATSTGASATAPAAVPSTSPVPAASMSAAGDVATAGY